MAGQFQVTCHKPDDTDADRRIEGLGGVGGWYLDIDVLIQRIESGTESFWTTTPEGKSVWIVVAVHPRSGRKYLKTEPDGALPNNLLALRECP